MKWKNLENNQILKAQDFFVSFNPDTSADKSGLGLMLNKLGGLISDGLLETDGRAETALIEERKGKQIFHILNGDFRKEYEELAPKGFKACYKFFLSKPELKSNWSTE